MIILATSQVIALTVSAGTATVEAAYADRNGATFTEGAQRTSLTATSGTVVSAPSAGVRLVKNLYVRSGSVATITVTVAGQVMRTIDLAASQTMDMLAEATMAGAALDSTVVHLAGTETITGAKTFSNGLTVSSGTTSLDGTLTPLGLTLMGALAGKRIEFTPASGLLEFFDRGTSLYHAARYLASSHSFEQGGVTCTTLTASSTTASTSTTTGALTCAGGGAFAKELVTGLGLWLVDGQTAPGATTGYAKVYVDTTDGDLKVIFGDGTIKTIVTDT